MVVSDIFNGTGSKRPFVATHRRKRDGLQAMLLSTFGGEALYRVQWFDGGKRHENTLSRPEITFSEQFESERPMALTHSRRTA